LDVHAAVIVGCLLVGGPHNKPRKEVRKFGTMTRDLEALRAWLREAGCTHVAMESTGVYWKPVHAALEDDFTVVVANARHIRNVPGRKTDVKDCEWIATLLRHGLLRSSFVPPRPFRALRKLLRYRAKLIQTRTAEENRLQGLLHSANIQLSNVASDVFGVSGMLMLRALVEGKASPEEIASLAKGRLRRKHDDLVAALEGRLDDDDRYLLRMQLDRIDALNLDVAALDRRIDVQLQPYQEIHARLTQIPGVNRVGAAVIIAELGIDMSVFLTAWHAASWAGVCPGNNESAGKQKGGRARKGNVHLRTALVQAATGASRARGTYLKDKYHRTRARRGPKRAALTVAHKILVAAYYMIARGEPYQELGPAYLDGIARQRITKGLVARLKRMGYAVELREDSMAA
jgi:transposase